MKSSFALCSDDTLSHHCIGNLEEACNISTDHHVAGLAALDGSLEACLEDALHDALELCIDFFKAPVVTDGVLAHSFNDPMLIAGQGTVGYEIMQDLKDVDTVVVPLGGGGVLAGVATAVKSINPKCRVIGAEPERIPRYSESRKQGKPVTVELKDTLADGLMITTTGTNTYPLIEEYVDEIVPVPEYAIAKALNYIVYKAKVVVEPSAAIGVAALISGGFKVKPGEKVCFVLTGGNIDPKKLIDLTEC